MSYLTQLSAFLTFVFLVSASMKGPLSAYIDSIPEYHLLETCAELELSTIVRDMSYGCGDDSKLTSYGCFCYESSQKYSSMIGAHIASACPQFPQQNTSAIEVFSKYCDLATFTIIQTQTVSSETGTPPASPGSNPANNPANSTSSPSDPNNPPSSKTNKVGVAVGVSVPITVIAISFAIIILWIRRRNKLKNQVALDEQESRGDSAVRNDVARVYQTYEIDNAETPHEQVHELRTSNLGLVTEMDGSERPHEMDIDEKKKLDYKA